MTSREEAERRYDQLLRERWPEVLDHVGAYRETLATGGVHAGEFSLPLRPTFVTPAGLRQLQHCVDVFWGALLKVFHVDFGGSAARIAPLLGLDGQVVETLERYFTPERSPAQLIGRSDAFAWGDELRFIEQNASSSCGGLPRIDALDRFFADLPPLRAMRADGPVRMLAPFDAYLELFSSPRYAGRVIGYLDALNPDGERWDLEGVRFLDALAARGVRLLDLTGRTLEARSDGAYADGVRLDVVYRGVAAPGLWYRADELRPLYEACQRGQLEMLTSPYEAVLSDKTLLAYLSDERLTDSLTGAERQLLDRIIPWTRLLREETVTFHGHRATAPTICRDRQAELVLKKGDGLASQAVVIGAECTAEQWWEHVEKGLADGNWIVQELVDPPRERLPFVVDGELVWSEVITMTCPYVLMGRVTGIAGRTSVPDAGRILVFAGAPGSTTGIRTAVRLG